MIRSMTVYDCVYMSVIFTKLKRFLCRPLHLGTTPLHTVEGRYEEGRLLLLCDIGETEDEFLYMYWLIIG